MATSGTIGTTTINTDKVIEHAFRRCGLPPSLQTPDTVEIGRDNLYLLLLNLANRGLNLWCVADDLIGLASDQATYTLPTGTLQILNLLYAQPTRASGTDTVAVSSVTTELTASTKVIRYGIKPTATLTTTAFTIASSDDGVSWTTRATLASATWVAGQWYWYDIDPAPTATWYRISSASNFTLTEFYLASDVTELPMTQFNRDEYSQQTVKYRTGRPSTNFYFQKTVAPEVSLWPVPNNNYDHLRLFRHRQVQDIGTLTQQIEAPQQWLEPLVWQLALRLAFEIPEVSAERRAEVIQASERYLMDGEIGETDHAPVYIFPSIGVYTR